MTETIPDSYETRTGSVLTVAPDRLVVRVKRSDDEDCSGCHSCAVKGLCRGRDDGHMDLPVPYTGTPPLKEGDNVRIAYRAANAALAALAMFLPALLGLFFGGLVGHRLAGESDAVFLIGCFAGFGSGLVMSFILARVVPALRSDVKLLPQA